MKKIVLVGGCFDVLHPGHIAFLEKAKKAGDWLVVLLESDEKVRLLKGDGRPVHNQTERAQILSALKAVNDIICLPYITHNRDYDEIVLRIKPAVIAAVEGDENITHYQRAAKIAGSKIKLVTKKVGNYSTSQLLDRNNKTRV